MNMPGPKTYLYLRVSTEKQSMESQEYELLRRFPDGIIVQETASGVKSRPELRKLLKIAKRGDKIAVAAFDRLGRSVRNVVTIIEELEERGVCLISLREGVSYDTPAGRLVTQILISVAEMERNMISDRTKRSLAAVKASGKRLGPSVKYDEGRQAEIRALRAQGLNYAEIKERTGASLNTLTRIIGEQGSRPRSVTEEDVVA